VTPSPPNTGRSAGLHGESPIEAVQTVYDQWAPFYDWNPLLNLVRPARRRTVDRLELTPGDTVVDMGTGTGANLPLLREAVGSEGQVIGVDISPQMLQQAASLVDSRGWTNVTLLKGDIRNPPLGKPVAGILSTFVVMMYADPGELIRSWSRYLQAGTMANLYAGPSDRGYAPVLNTLLSFYLRLFESGWNTTSRGYGPLDVLAERGDRARSSLGEQADTFHTDSKVFGLAKLDVGQFR